MAAAAAGRAMRVAVRAREVARARGERRVDETRRGARARLDRDVTARAARGGGARGGGRGGEIQRLLANADSAEAALRVVEKDLDSFDGVHAATALHRVAKFSAPESRLDRDYVELTEGVTRDARFKALAESVASRVDEFDAFGLANVAWSFAKLGYTPSQETLSALASRLEREISKPGARLKPQSLSNATYAFGRMRYKPPVSTLEALCSATAREMSAFRADELSGMMLGLAHLDHVPSREFLDEARRFIEKHLRRFDDAAACNILWAFARMETTLSGDIIDALLIQLTAQNLGGANSHVNVPMCMYACARLDHSPSPAFVRAMNAEIPRCAQRMNIGSIDSMFWALGSLGGVGEGKVQLGVEAYEALCAAVSAKRDIDAELVSKVFWALAKVNYRPTDSTLVGLGRMAKGRARELEDENILLVMHAWGVLRWNPGNDVVDEYVSRFIADEGALNASQAAKLLCAYGRVRWLPPITHADALLARLMHEASRGGLHPATAVLGLWGSSLLGLDLEPSQLDVLAQNTIRQNLSAKSLAKCVWSLAALGYDPTPLDLADLKRLADDAFGKLPVKDQTALKQAMSRLGA